MWPTIFTKFWYFVATSMRRGISSRHRVNLGKTEFGENWTWRERNLTNFFGKFCFCQVTPLPSQHWDNFVKVVRKSGVFAKLILFSASMSIFLITKNKQIYVPKFLFQTLHRNSFHDLKTICFHLTKRDRNNANSVYWYVVKIKKDFVVCFVNVFTSFLDVYCEVSQLLEGWEINNK